MNGLTKDLIKELEEYEKQGKIIECSIDRDVVETPEGLEYSGELYIRFTINDNLKVK